MKKTNRLIDFFAVIGPDNTFTCNDPEIEKEKDITTLEIINGFFNNIENFNKEESEEWIDLDGTRTIWLKISYSQRSVPPVTHMEFMYIPMEGDHLKIPMNYECFPVPVKKFGEKNVQHGFGGQIKNYHLFKGSYDLTKLLDAEPKNGYSLVLCYRVQSKTNYSTAISHIKLVYGEKSKKLYKANYNPNDYHIFIPKDYKPLNITFGVPEKNRMLCFKKKTDIFKISYMPKVLDKYPNEEFPEAIAMFCFPEGMYLYQNDSPSPKAFSFVLTQSDGARIYGTTLCFFEPVPKELYKNIGHIDSSKVTVIGQKAICLISHYPYMNEFKRILKQLYRISLSFSDLPIERYISNIVNDIRAPLENGNFSIQCDIGSDSVIFNTGFQFPYLSEESLKNFFRVLDVERIIYLFGCVLLERKILLISKYKSLLTQVAECLTGLIYPFMWTHVLIPILPENLKSYIEAPVPFIIGISSENKTGEDSNALKQNDTIRVYLDTSDLIFIDNLPPFPEKAINQLRKRLSPYENFHKTKSKDILENIDSAFDIAILDIDPNENFNAYEIRDAFFEFNTSYLKDYRKYVSGLNQKKIVSSDFSELFNAKAFLEANKSQKQGSFLYKLIETGLFAFFIESCLYIQNNIDFTFLNNALKAKREKKNPIILQPEKAHKIIPCPQPTDQNLPVKKAPYRYMIFPKLNSEFFAKPLFQMESVMEGNKSVDKIGDLDSLDESKWAKLLLESIYTLWYIIFNIRIKLVYNENYSFLTEYAHFMLDDMRKKGLIPNITILRCLIEAIGYYFADKQDKLQEIVKLMNQEKIDSMNLHGAYISAVSNGRSLKKESEKFNKSKTQIEYDDEDMDEKPEEKVIGKKFSSEIQGQLPKLKKKNSNPFLSQFDNIILSFDDNCPHCNRQMYPEEIFSGWKKSYQEYVTSCPSCKKGFSSCLKIIEFQGENSKSITVNLLSPIVVRKELENINHHIGGKNIFKESFQQNQQHRVIFWNIYFYLNLIKAPTFILDKNENPEFIEENSKNIFKEMKLSKPSKTMVMQAGNSSANGFSWKDGSIDRNIIPNSPQLTIFSNNQKSMQSPNFSNLTVPANKASIVLPSEKNNMANNSIKKVFGNLIKEFKIINENKLNSIKSNQI